MRARLVAVLLAEENRKWWTLFAVAFGLFMIMLDNTVVNVALPTMQRDLHVSISQLEWVVIATFAPASWRRCATAGAAKPEKIGTCTAPMCAHACEAIATSGHIGR